MGAATVGKGQRSTTYTGVRGEQQPKGKGGRRERDLLRGLERQRRYMASAAPGAPTQIRDPTVLTGVKSTNSPNRMQLPPTAPRSRRRDTRNYSPCRK